jgi:hypothetical protein
MSGSPLIGACFITELELALDLYSYVQVNACKFELTVLCKAVSNG